MKNYLLKIISSLVYSLSPNIFKNNIDKYAYDLNSVTEVIWLKIQSMPRYLGIPMVFLTIVFDFYGLIIKGQRFHKQHPQIRSQLIQNWKNSSVTVFNDFIRFYETLTIFICYSSRGMESKLESNSFNN